MKKSKYDSLFKVILSTIFLLQTMQVSARGQLDRRQNISKNITRWGKCKTFAKGNIDYIAAAIIPALVTVKLVSRRTLESRRKQAQDSIASCEKNFFLEIILPIFSPHWGARLNEEHWVIRANDKQLKKFMMVENCLIVLGTGIIGFAIYSVYKNWNSPDFWRRPLTPEERAKLLVESLKTGRERRLVSSLIT